MTSDHKTTKGLSSSSGSPLPADKTVREQSLRQELANVKKVNEAIEGVIRNLEKAESNMKTVNHTVGAASSLLNIWTRILSQTEHNQRLILDPSWQGASQDVADMEEETLIKQQATERKDAEEQERKAAAVKKLEEVERMQTESITKPSKPTVRGRGRGTSRASTSTSSGYGKTSSTNTSTSSIGRGTTAARRTTSGIGRGTTRGQPRA